MKARTGKSGIVFVDDCSIMSTIQLYLHPPSYLSEFPPLAPSSSSLPISLSLSIQLLPVTICAQVVLAATGQNIFRGRVMGDEGTNVQPDGELEEGFSGEPTHERNSTIQIYATDDERDSSSSSSS